MDGAAYSEPLSFKVPSSQAAEAKEVVRLVKEHYLFLNNVLTFFITNNTIF